jgi:RNA polymerase sigma-70 factor, ECF subfamily
MRLTIGHEKMAPMADQRAKSDLPSDGSLVMAALGGDRGAFAQLVVRYEKPARAVCLAILRDEHLASDAAQDSFLAAYRSLGSLRDRGAFGAWLMHIARNRAIRLARNRRREAPLPSSLAESATAQTDFEVLDAVTALPEQERVVVMLRYFQRHEVPEIAAILERPIGTVTKQLSRARERLRRSLTMEDVP